MRFQRGWVPKIGVLVSLLLVLAGPAARAAKPMLGVQRLLDAPAYEPTIGITSQGALFYPVGVPGKTEIVASYDNGTTWENVTPSFVLGPDYQEGFDPYLAVDPLTSRVYRALYRTSRTGGCIDLLWSDDEGKTWTNQPKACGIGGLTHDHESLATGIPRTPIPTVGYPNLLYLCVNRLEGSGCSASRDGGFTFGPWVNVYSSVDPEVEYGLCGGLHAPVVTDSDGRVFLPRTYCGVPSIAVSEDEGLTWKIHKINTEHPPLPSEWNPGGGTMNYIDVQDVMVTVDSDDNLYAAWVARDGFVYVSVSQDHGATWGKAWNVKVPGLTAVGPKMFAIEAGAPGKLAFAFVGTDHPGGFKDNKKPEQWKGARWNLYIATTQNGLSASPKLRGVIANPKDDPIGTDTCGLDRCPAPCEGVCAGMYDYIDVDIDRHGRPWVAFVDVCQAECRDTGQMDEAIAAIATLSEGTALTAAGGALPRLPWAQPAASPECRRCI